MNDAEILRFSIAERDRRWRAARSLLDDLGLDALLVFGEHEDAGPAAVAYDTWFTNGRPGTTVVLPRTGDPVVLFPAPMFIMDHLESTRRGEAPWIQPANLRTSRTSGALAAVLAELGFAQGRIGVVGLGPHLPWHPEGIVPFGLWSAVLAQLPDAEFRSVDLELGQLRMRLSDEELAMVRRSAQIGDSMVEAMVEAARPGVPENHIYAAGMAAGYAGGTVPANLHLWSGPDPVAAGLPGWGYRPETPRVLRDGDIIYSEVFSHFGGLHTQHQVTIAVGEVHADYARAASLARSAYDAGLAALRPGRTFGDVVDAMHEPLDAADGSIFLITAHSLNPGLAVGKGRSDIRRLPGAEAYPPVPDGHPTFLADLELVPGMTFVLEPQYAFGRHLAHLGGTVIVGQDEPVELSPYTARLLRAGR
ncbi:M24 family metallopeptidase [Nonomuraea sp. B5E05]|uniref:M24 family metallopeptidase n=1 Tax=Nonomuraea sp. B5E05 TaxID=3153569 RepID=UPI003260EFE5